jgi:hypothetical protein
MTQEAVIVHESVHAGLDLARASRMRLISSEAAGFIAQCTYARLKTGDPNERLMGSTPESDRVFEIAWGLAGDVRAGRQLTTADLDALRYAVSQHPRYRNARTLAGYDGVP